MSSFSERDVLRKQIRNDIVEHLRRDRGAPAPGATFARVVTAMVLGRRDGTPAAAIAAKHFPYDADVTKGLARPGSIFKAASGPAMTTVPAWAGELVTPGVLGALQIIAPQSVYSQLSRTPASIRVDLSGRTTVKVPSRAPTPPAAPPFVGEGLPIPVRQLALSNATLSRKKAAVISVLTNEISNHSAPDLEQIIRGVLGADTSTAVDSVLLDANPANAIRPAGILNGVAPTTATAGGGLAAFAGDVRALAAAIEATGPIAAPMLIMSSTSALLLAILTQKTDMPIIAAPTVPAKQLIMVDAANFASGEGDTPDLMTSTETTLHMEDTTPLPIGTPGGVPVTDPAIVAAPTSSMFQTASIAVRLLQDVEWVMTRAGRVAFVQTVSW